MHNLLMNETKVWLLFITLETQAFRIILDRLTKLYLKIILLYLQIKNMQTQKQNTTLASYFSLITQCILNKAYMQLNKLAVWIILCLRRYEAYAIRIRNSYAVTLLCTTFTCLRGTVFYKTFHFINLCTLS